MTAGVSGTTTIDAPPATVFAILADPRQHARIDGSGSVQDVVEAPDVLSLGATFSVKMQLGTGYQVTNTVVEFEQDRLIAWKHFAPQRWRYELEPTNGGTRVTETWDISHYPWPTRIFLTLARFPKRNQAGIDGTLVKLKEAAERDAAAGSGGYRGGMSIRKGTTVTWSWGSSTAEGTVVEVHHDKVTRTTKGEQVTRNGSDDDPAYVIEQDDGTKVLKLQSEVERA